MSGPVTVDGHGELLRGLVARALLRRYRTGEALFLQGDIADRLFVLERGAVKIASASDSGHDVVLGLRGPGDVVGELSAIDGEPRTAAAIALSPVEARVLAAREFNAAIDADPHAARELLRLVTARLRDADRKRVEFASLDTLGRVSTRLLELCERFGREDEDGCRIEVTLSQEELAAWCGASREASVKALKTLRDLGLVTTGRRSMIVLDRAALARHAAP